MYYNVNVLCVYNCDVLLYVYTTMSVMYYNVLCTMSYVYITVMYYNVLCVYNCDVLQCLMCI